MIGHTKGYETITKILRHAVRIGIKYLSVYALSIKNLERNEREVKHLFKLLEKGLKDIANDEEIVGREVKINVLGRTELLPKGLQEGIKAIEDKTRNHDKHFLNLCIAYDGQDEIVDAVKKIVEDGAGPISKKLIKSHLYTKDSPAVDLIIRTGMGDGARISGFLLWDASYAEFIFRNEYWPDYTEQMFEQDLEEYASRMRRFGK